MTLSDGFSVKASIKPDSDVYRGPLSIRVWWKKEREDEEFGCGVFRSDDGGGRDE